MAVADSPVHEGARDRESEGMRDHDSDREPESATSKDEEKETPPAEAAPEPNAKPPQPGPPGGPPPNGGLTAWLQVVGSWMLFFNTWVRDFEEQAPSPAHRCSTRVLY